MRIRIRSVALLSCFCAASCQTQPDAPPTTSAPVTVPSESSCFQAREILPFAFSQDAQSILLRSESGVQSVELATGRELLFVPAPASVVTAALSPDGQTMAWSFQDGQVQIMRLADQGVLATFSGHPDPVYDLSFDSGGDRLFSASHDGTVRIWDLAGKELGAIQPGGEVLGFGVSPDGAQLATIPSDGPVQVWDISEATKLKDLGGTSGYDTSDAHFSTDGLYLATDLATGLYLWKVRDGQLLWSAVTNTMAAAFSPDGEYFAYTDINDGNSVVLAPPDASSVIRTIDRMAAPIWEMFFSPDSSLLLATDGTEIRVWEIPGGALRYVGRLECP